MSVRGVRGPKCDVCYISSCWRVCVVQTISHVVHLSPHQYVLLGAAPSEEDFKIPLL